MSAANCPPAKVRTVSDEMNLHSHTAALQAPILLENVTLSRISNKTDAHRRSSEIYYLLI